MEIPKRIIEYWEAFGDLIFPPYCSCIICKGKLRTGFHGICCNCIEGISFIKKGRWLQTTEIEGGSSYRIYSVVEYSGEIRRMIYRLKYGHETYLAREMAKMMADFILREGITADLLISVPLHKSREKERGFNQAALLAKYIAKYSGIPYSSNALVRNKKTTVMHQLSKSQRKSNVQGAFSVEEPEIIDGKEIILLDDILTTGATIEACIKSLLGAGVASINVLTFARGKIEGARLDKDWKNSDNGGISLYNE